MDSAENKDNTRSFFIPAVGISIGHYTLLNRLGSGGMGDVFLAEDSKLNRKVALKFLSQQLSDDIEAKNRFIREAQAAAALNHPNIVTIYEVSEHAGRPFIAMENVAGRSLKDLLNEDLPLSKVIDIAIQLCDGLQKAHQAGVVHRDVKPANIVVDTDGRPKLLDFGLATVKGADSITRAGSTLGTIAYMSPEQAQGKTVDHRSDIFSIGIMLYEMITRRQPFARDTDAATLGAIIYDSPEPLANYQSGVSQGLQDVIDRALDKDLETRYQSASGLAADLKREKRALEGSSTSHSSPSVKSMRPVKKSHLPLILSTSGALAVILLLLVLKPWNLSIVTDQQAQASEQWLAIMYFDNLTDQTDQQRLGEIVTNLLITDLSEAKSVKVVSSQRLYDLLKQLGKEGERRIDRDMSSQVAKKAGARWMLTGTILQVEPEIIMTSQLIDVASGGVLVSQRVNGKSGEKIFAVAEALARQLRSDNAFPREIKPVGEASLANAPTSSAEAYRYYLEGVEHQNRFFGVEARAAFKHAVQFDSTFAIAWMRLASESNGPEWQLAADMAKRYIDHASPRDRMLIQAYLARTTNDNRTARKVMEDAAARYPDDKGVQHELAVSLANVGEPRLAITAINKVLELDPQYKTAWNQLAYTYLKLHVIDSAHWAIDHYMKLAPEEPNPYDSKADIFAYSGNFDSAAVYYRKALEIRPDFTVKTVTKLGIVNMLMQNYDEAGKIFRRAMNSSDSFERQAARTQWVNLFIYQGKLKEAIDANKVAYETDQLEGLTDNALNRTVVTARLYFHLGDVERAWQELQTIREFRDTSSAYKFKMADRAPVTSTWFLAELGRDKEALALIDSVSAEARIDSNLVTVVTRMQGVYYWVKKDYEEAIEQFKYLDSWNASFTTAFELGRTYLDAGRFAEAAAVFERVRNDFDEIRFQEAAVYNGLFYYYLGRTYEGLGQLDQAKKDYTVFASIWKNADAGIKELQDGRARLARLKQKA